MAAGAQPAEPLPPFVVEPISMGLRPGIDPNRPALGVLATDAQLAAIAIEHQAELHSNDADFSRLSGLRWRNPLKAK